MTPASAEDEAREARAALARHGGTPAQVAAVTLALDAGVRVLFICHPTLGEPSFVVFRPVPPNVEEVLNALPVTEATYVTTNPNWNRIPYWDIQL